MNSPACQGFRSRTGLPVDEAELRRGRGICIAAMLCIGDDVPEPKTPSAASAWPSLSLNATALLDAVEDNAARIQDLRQKNAELEHLLDEVDRMRDHPVTAQSGKSG